MASLQEIRARIAAQENRSQKSSGPSDNSIYAHWNMGEGTTATIRFLPDGDSKNEFFWVEKQVIKLPFNGVKGDPSSKQVTVVIPCMEMYGESCPILAEVRPWYKDESLKEMANKYWKKRSYLFQGFVRQNPMGDDVTPANPIRRFVISPQLIPIIKTGLMDPEMEELPTHYTKGLDFIVRKTSKGGYADYSTSNWARKESPLTEAEQAAIEAHGLFNLSEFLPKKPTAAEVAIMKEMFEASVDGLAYDPDKWGQYFKPYGLEVAAPKQSSANTVTETVAHAQAVPVADADDLPFDPDPVVVPKAAVSSSKAEDILAKIRARQGNQV
jgi:hypothetical protein